MTWIKVDEYHLKNQDWTICRYGGEPTRYALWHGNINKGYFDTWQAAKQEWERVR